MVGEAVCPIHRRIRRLLEARQRRIVHAEVLRVFGTRRTEVGSSGGGSPVGGIVGIGIRVDAFEGNSLLIVQQRRMPVGGIGHFVHHARIRGVEKDECRPVVVQDGELKLGDTVLVRHGIETKDTFTVFREREVGASLQRLGERAERVVFRQFTGLFARRDGQATEGERPVGAVVKLDILAAATGGVGEELVDDDGAGFDVGDGGLRLFFILVILLFFVLLLFIIGERRGVGRTRRTALRVGRKRPALGRALPGDARFSLVVGNIVHRRAGGIEQLHAIPRVREVSRELFGGESPVFQVGKHIIARAIYNKVRIGRNPCPVERYGDAFAINQGPSVQGNGAGEGIVQLDILRVGHTGRALGVGHDFGNIDGAGGEGVGGILILVIFIVHIFLRFLFFQDKSQLLGGDFQTVFVGKTFDI